MTVIETRTARAAVPDLTPPQELAVLARMLHREGYNDHNFGHITYRQDDDTLLVNPYELAWDELRASDVARMDMEGRQLGGDGTINKAVQLHVELYRARPDVRVAVHHHPEWATVWAAIGEEPPVYDQMGAIVDGPIALYDEYSGEVSGVDAARRNVAGMGDASAGLLRNHGVFVLGDSIRRAHELCVGLEARCRLAWRVEVLGQSRGQVMPPDVVADLTAGVLQGVLAPHFYDAAVRREIRHDPTVLD